MLTEEQIWHCASMKIYRSSNSAIDGQLVSLKPSDLVAFARAIEARVIAQIKDKEISDRIKAACNCYGVGGGK